MPDSCAKALAPTIALFGCTGKPVMPETSLLAGTIWRRIDARLTREHVLTSAHGHDDFLERRVAGALAKPVDRAFDLARAIQHCR